MRPTRLESEDGDEDADVQLEDDGEDGTDQAEDDGKEATDDTEETVDEAEDDLEQLANDAAEKRVRPGENDKRRRHVRDVSEESGNDLNLGDGDDVEDTTEGSEDQLRRR